MSDEEGGGVTLELQRPDGTPYASVTVPWEPDDDLDDALDRARRALEVATGRDKEHDHVWVTALDGNDQPARDENGRTWTHCGVCGRHRDQLEVQ